MKLVEVIRTEQTEPEVFDKAYAWVGEIGKVAVSCGDTPVSCSERMLHLSMPIPHIHSLYSGLYCQSTLGPKFAASHAHVGPQRCYGS